MKAVVVNAYNQPLEVKEVPTPEPGPGQVLVKIEASGLCHTDIHAAHGDWPVKAPLPFTPGHEGVGLVERCGPGVKNLREGDRVAIPWLGWACGSCDYCISGWETLCPQANYTGYTVNGCHAEYAIAHAAFAARVPATMDPTDAAPLACAGVTTYKAVKTAGVGPSDLVAVFGIGGLGHLATQYAQIAGATVVAVDRQDTRLTTAKTLGATYTVNSNNEDPVEAIQALGGAHVAIVTASGLRPYEQAFSSLRRNGTLVLLGAPKENVLPLPIFQTILLGIKVVGSAVGTRLDLAETLALHASGRTTVVKETRSLDEVNEAIAEVEQGKPEARLVFDLAS
jgi:alcohol dehydrogenase, propanol-preferring